MNVLIFVVVIEEVLGGKEVWFNLKIKVVAV